MYILSRHAWGNANEPTAVTLELKRKENLIRKFANCGARLFILNGCGLSGRRKLVEIEKVEKSSKNKVTIMQKRCDSKFFVLFAM